MFYCTIQFWPSEGDLCSPLSSSVYLTQEESLFLATAVQAHLQLYLIHWNHNLWPSLPLNSTIQTHPAKLFVLDRHVHAY